MYITDYYLLNGHIYPKIRYRVEPIEKASDSAYESPERDQKGKRDFKRKRANSKKFPEKIFTFKRHTLSIWV